MDYDTLRLYLDGKPVLERLQQCSLQIRNSVDLLSSARKAASLQPELIEAAWRYGCEQAQEEDISVELIERWKERLTKEHENLHSYVESGRNSRNRKQALDSDIRAFWGAKGLQALCEKLGYEQSISQNTISRRTLEQLRKLASRCPNFDLATAQIAEQIEVRHSHRTRSGSHLELRAEDVDAVLARQPDCLREVSINIDTRKRKRPLKSDTAYHGRQTKENCAPSPTPQLLGDDSYTAEPTGLSMEVGRAQAFPLSDVESSNPDVFEDIIALDDERFAAENLSPRAAPRLSSPTENSSPGETPQPISPASAGAFSDSPYPRLYHPQLGIAMPAEADGNHKTLGRDRIPPNTLDGATSSLEGSCWLSTSAMALVLQSFDTDKIRSLDPSFLDGDEARILAKPLLRKLGDCQQLVIPMHHDDHWTIAVIDLQRGTKNWYDPWHERHHETEAFEKLRILELFLKAHDCFPKPCERWPMHVLDRDLQQKDSASCGIYCLVWALAQVQARKMPDRISTTFWRKLFIYLINDSYQDDSVGQHDHPCISPPEKQGTAAAAEVNSPISLTNHQRQPQRNASMLSMLKQLEDQSRCQTDALSQSIQASTQDLQALQSCLPLLACSYEAYASRLRDFRDDEEILRRRLDEYRLLIQSLEDSTIVRDRAALQAMLDEGMRVTLAEQQQVRQIRGWQRAKAFWERELRISEMAPAQARKRRDDLHEAVEQHRITIRALREGLN